MMISLALLLQGRPSVEPIVAISSVLVVLGALAFVASLFGQLNEDEIKALD